MEPIEITRPEFPDGYADHPKTYLTWDWVAARLTESLHYWLCTVRPDGRPHVVPRWCVYLDGKIYYDGSPDTRHARNLEHNPQTALHLESGQEAIILEGISKTAPKPDSALGQTLAQAYQKYAPLGYTPGPASWDNGGLFVFMPRQCIAWSNFTDNPTKFVFEEGRLV